MKHVAISKQTLCRLWALTGVAALLTFAVLRALETILQAKTGIGTVNLQMAETGPEFRFLMDRWQDPAAATLSGFSLGFDFLFIPLYGAALYLGALFARDRFAARPGTGRRILNALTLAAPIAALCDIAEDILELTMLMRGPNDVLTAFAFDASTMKFAALAIALLVNIAAIAGLLVKKSAA